MSPSAADSTLRPFYLHSLTVSKLLIRNIAFYFYYFKEENDNFNPFFCN